MSIVISCSDLQHMAKSSQIKINKKDCWGQRKNPPPMNNSLIVLCDNDIQINTSNILVYYQLCTDLLQLKMSVTLTLTFEAHSRSYELDQIVQLGSTHMVSY